MTEKIEEIKILEGGREAFGLPETAIEKELKATMDKHSTESIHRKKE
jgi:hypothetical protein